jgi:hypothetical protein
VFKRTAQHHAPLFEQKFVKTVKRNFYVDDCLKSGDNEQNVFDLVRNLQSIIIKVVLDLFKWITNSRTVLSIIPDFNIRTSGETEGLSIIIDPSKYSELELNTSDMLSLANISKCISKYCQRLSHYFTRILTNTKSNNLVKLKKRAPMDEV